MSPHHAAQDEVTCPDRLSALLRARSRVPTQPLATLPDAEPTQEVSVTSVRAGRPAQGTPRR